MKAGPQPAKGPQEYLAEADRYFYAGDQRAGSKCVWLAVHTALAAVAARRGHPFRNDDDAFRLVVELNREDGDTREPIGGYSIAQGFQDNSLEVWEEDNFDLSLYHWDEDGFELARPLAAKFVDYLVKKAEQDAPRQ